MTGQLSLDLGPIRVVEADRRHPVARTYPPLRKDRVWWRGRKWRVENVPVVLAGVL